MSHGQAVNIREALSNALAYWEPRRLIYNAVLLVITLVMFFLGQPATKAFLNFTGLMSLLVLAVLANIFYSVVYGLDVVVQLSNYRDAWLRWRFLLFWFGLILAALLTVWVTGVGIVGLWLSSSAS